MGEHASSSGDTGDGKLLWLNRPSFSVLADISLLISIPGSNGIHDSQGFIVLQSFASPELDQSRGLRRRVLCVEVAFWAGAEMPTWFPSKHQAQSTAKTGQRTHVHHRTQVEHKYSQNINFPTHGRRKIHQHQVPPLQAIEGGSIVQEFARVSARRPQHLPACLGTSYTY